MRNFVIGATQMFIISLLLKTNFGGGEMSRFATIHAHVCIFEMDIIALIYIAKLNHLLHGMYHSNT